MLVIAVAYLTVMSRQCLVVVVVVGEGIDTVYHLKFKWESDVNK